MLLPEDLHPYNYSYYISRLEGPSELQEVFLEASILYTKQCVQLIHRSEKHFILYEQFLKEEEVKTNEKESEANAEGDIEDTKKSEKTNAKNSEKNDANKSEKPEKEEKPKKDEKIIEGQISCITINSDDEPEIKFCKHKSIQVRFENTLHFFITSNALCFTILQNDGVFTCLSRFEDDICYMYTVFTTKKKNPNYFLELFKSPKILLKDFEVHKDDGLCFGDKINNDDPSDEMNKDGLVDNLTEKFLNKLRRDEETVNQMYNQGSKSLDNISKVNDDLSLLKVTNTHEMQDIKHEEIKDKVTEDLTLSRIATEDKIREATNDIHDYANIEKKELKKVCDNNFNDSNFCEISNATKRNVENNFFDFQDFSDETKNKIIQELKNYTKIIEKKAKEFYEETKKKMKKEALKKDKSGDFDDVEMIKIDDNEEEMKNHIKFGKIKGNTLVYCIKDLEEVVSLENINHLLFYICLSVLKMIKDEIDFLEIRSEIDFTIMKEDNEFTLLFFDQVCKNDITAINSFGLIKKKIEKTIQDVNLIYKNCIKVNKK